ncbi:MAG: hypothetical protein OJF49_001953 [Ktedonobacterales bacterium]|jgi:predicted secreted protein|nr:MAG: hypothetical protein OJF49_001953 [Ktedonobacterales bacterium]
MAGQRRRNARGALVVAVIFVGLAVALFVLLPGPINRSHTTQIPTPGQVTLPPTAPAAATAATTATTATTAGK